MICKNILLMTFLNKPKLIFFTLLSDFKYFDLIWIILSTKNHLFVQSKIVPRNAMWQYEFSINHFLHTFKRIYIYDLEVKVPW